tara:strand:- start:309 stop:500 length:192 start_codon:yes stop_codon:yes gene_type:complete
VLAVQIQEQEVQIQYSVQLHQQAVAQAITIGLVMEVHQVVQAVQAVVQEQIQVQQVEVEILHQ